MWNFGIIDALLFIRKLQTTDLTPQHVFEAPNDYLRKEDKTK